MTTLRAKLAVLIAVAMISTFSIITGVLMYILNPRDERQRIVPLADQVHFMEQVARVAPDLVTFQQRPADGKIDTEVTSWLREMLQARGMPRDALVSRSSDNVATLSIPADEGWLVAGITDLPPPGGVFFWILTWLALFASGAIAIAIFFANRMVKPLVLLERTIESVRPDALLPELPVTGPEEVRVTARALNSLSSRLKAALESRMRLVAAAGHDLRTPITRMRLRAEFVENDDDRAMWLKDIDELAQIADSAILLVREESGRFVPELLRLDTLISDLVDELRTLSYDVTLTGCTEATVRANRTSLNRAFRNLIINAATHGKRARVAVQSMSSEAVVVIDDEGPGIPPTMLCQVFEPFFRVHPARTKTIDGAGLGLTIAHDIVQRAGGSITIENGPMQGLQQTVKLPIVVQPAIAGAPVAWA